MTKIYRCTHCSEYMLDTECFVCHRACVSPLPAKWSPEDKYGTYRRAYKKRFSR